MRETIRVASEVVDARGQGSSTVKGEYLLFHCLVVSPDAERQQLFANAAAEQGWEAIVVSDAESALRSMRRMFVQLAIVCGNANDMEEEIFVRQLGAWLYLPGVDADTNLSLLCGEAKCIVERQHAAAQSPARQKSPMRRAN